MTMENNPKRLTRRDFIRGSVGATLAASVLGMPWADGTEAAGRSSIVTIVRDKNVMDAGFKVDSKILKTMLDRTVLQLTGKAKIQEGNSVEESFEYAKDYLRATFGYYGAQTPAILYGSSVVPDQLYYGLSMDATDMIAPDLEGVSETCLVYEASPSTQIYALAVDETEVESVKATLRKPDGETVTIDLAPQYVGSRKYIADLDADDLDQVGTYTVTFIAVDTSRNCSEPKISQISVVSELPEFSSSAKHWEELE